MKSAEHRQQLPASVELAWGRRERPAKGPRRALTLERIVEAAIRVGEAEGLEAVSMSRVAAEVGVSTMALYRYVPAKADLLTIMQDTLFGPPPEPPAPGTGWREGLLWWAGRMRAVVRRHTWALRVPVNGPPVMPHSVAWMETGLRCLRGTGLDDGTKLSILVLVSGFVRSEALLAADLAAAFERTGNDPSDALTGYGPMLLEVLDEHRFPELYRAARSGVFEEEDDPDWEFMFGMERLLDGIEVLVRPQCTENPPSTNSD
ncbi:TetR/AcrR family transcriptional regulator [Actinomadura kijaniata]|uniref:TetR/AcrR family transcriptional regulator n=1 Tax=Actinomadura kijaniata TaxID=46161 RepID=UPI0008357602|nr:TetR/AcrR family transcriptional regulator [Actinomadura kijaniata]